MKFQNASTVYAAVNGAHTNGEWYMDANSMQFTIHEIYNYEKILLKQQFLCSYDFSALSLFLSLRPVCVQLQFEFHCCMIFYIRLLY